MGKIARPFLKWVGGKSRLLEQIERFLPCEFKNEQIHQYVEPFLGSAAVFFHLSARYSFKNAYLSDLNKDLILTYTVVQQKCEKLLEFLKKIQDEHNAARHEKRGDFYLSVRELFNKQRFKINYDKMSDNWIPRAAQFIFLNKTCYNGLFRLNSKGEFNVPFGRYKKASIFNEENILSASDVLQNAVLIQSDYKNCYGKIDQNTFVYFDPPYRPLNRTSNFTSYTDNVFNEKQQLELAAFYKKLDREKGARLMLSNSDPKNINPNDDFFERAYEGCNISKVSASRFINCKSGSRGKINELLITNY